MTKERCWECGAVTKIVGTDGNGDPEYKCPKCGCTLIAKEKSVIINWFIQ